MSQEKRLQEATEAYRQQVEDAKTKFADTIRELADAINNRATPDELDEIQDQLDDKHSDLKENLPGELDFDEDEYAWTKWVTDVIANQDYETQLASAIVGDGVDDIRELVESRIAALQSPAL